MDPFFDSDSYQTPDDKPRYLLDRLSFNSRYHLYARFIGQVLRSRWLVARERYNREAVAHTTYNVFKIIEKCGGRFHITGLDNIRCTPEPVVYISNHMSTLENSIFPCFIAPIKPVTFVIKSSLLKYPIFGPVLGSQNPVAVERVNPREDFQKVMEDGTALLQKGISVILFPQSTRTTTFIPKEFNSLGVKLARKANVLVSPVALKTNFWGNGRFMRDFGPVDRTQPIHFAFGQPFTVQNSRQAHQQVIDFITDHLQQWQT